MAHDAEQPPRLLLPTLFPLRKVRLVTPDPLQERVRQVVRDAYAGSRHLDRIADAILADLREAGELRIYEQVGSRWHDGKMVATYIVREDNDG